MNMQISAANSRAAFDSRASKFLVTNRTLSYSAKVSGTRKIWYQNAWHQIPVPETWAENLGRVPWASATTADGFWFLLGSDYPSRLDL